MKTLLTVASLSIVTFSLIVFIFLGGKFSEASAKIEAERVGAAKVMCADGSKWVKLKGELNTRNCTTFKI